MKDFEKFYTEYLSYKALYGKNGVSFRYYAAGYPLGQRACALRNGNAKVTEEQRKMLDEEGFPWKTTKRHKQCPFNIFYAELLKYQKEFGTIDVPRYYETEDGIRLGMVLKSFKYGSRKLTPYQKKKLLAIGFAFDKKFYRSYSFEKVLIRVNS